MKKLLLVGLLLTATLTANTNWYTIKQDSAALPWLPWLPGTETLTQVWIETDAARVRVTVHTTHGDLHRVVGGGQSMIEVRNTEVTGVEVVEVDSK